MFVLMLHRTISPRQAKTFDLSFVRLPHLVNLLACVWICPCDCIRERFQPEEREEILLEVWDSRWLVSYSRAFCQLKAGTC